MEHSRIGIKNPHLTMIKKTAEIKDLMLTVMPMVYGKPTETIINLTERCNSRCITCHAWKNNSPGEDLSKEHIFKFVDSLSEFTRIKNFTLSGGEPLLRKDIFDIIRYISKKGKVILLTNGSLLNKKTIDSLVQSGISSINVSINAMEPHVHDRSKGIKGNLNQILASINYIKDNYPDLKLEITTVIYRENVNRFIPILKFAERFGIPVSFQPIQNIFYSGTGSLSKASRNILFDNENPDLLLNTLNTIRSYKIKGYNISIPLSFLKEYSDFARSPMRKKIKKCKIGFSKIILKNNGDINLCWQSGPIGTIILSNNIKKIWNSKIAKKQREQMLHCSRKCESFCYLTPTIPDAFIEVFLFLKKQLNPRRQKS